MCVRPEQNGVKVTEYNNVWGKGIASTHLLLIYTYSLLDSKGDIGSAEYMVMAYSGKALPSGHIMNKAKAICCPPFLEETQCSPEPLTWLLILIEELHLDDDCCVIDIFGAYGKCSSFV